MSGLYTNIFDHIVLELIELPKDYLKENAILENSENTVNKNSTNFKENEEALVAQQLTDESISASDRSSESPNTTVSSDAEQSEISKNPKKSKHLDLSKPFELQKNKQQLVTEQNSNTSEVNLTNNAHEKTSDVATSTAEKVVNKELSATSAVTYTSFFDLVRNGYKLFTHDKDITNQKLRHFEDLISAIKNLSNDLPDATVLAPRQLISTETNKQKQRADEIKKFQEKLQITLEHANMTKVKLRQARDGKKPIGTAEPRVEVIIEALEWLASDHIIEILYLVYGKESHSKNPSLALNLYKQSANIIVDVFKWAFYIKLHELKVKHAVMTREIDSQVAENLLEGFINSIETLNTSLHQPFNKIVSDPAAKLEWEKQIIDALRTFIDAKKSLLHSNNISPQNYYKSWFYEKIFLEEVAESIQQYSERLKFASYDNEQQINSSKINGRNQSLQAKPKAFIA